MGRINYLLRFYNFPNGDCNRVSSDTGMRQENKGHVPPFPHKVTTRKSYKTHSCLASHVKDRKLLKFNWITSLLHHKKLSWQKGKTFFVPQFPLLTSETWKVGIGKVNGSDKLGKSYEVTTNFMDLPNMVRKKAPITEAIKNGLKQNETKKGKKFNVEERKATNQN